ncbi:hypothetical protein AVEN_66237-1 [Araneus ventricosus]|uniref:Uncharacterized protein n=1 Tax=Araneus ventricosus TaxID=182803 RepID=A0A4Y2I5J4_ARAVE|nr:hypothetical protein AVEN_66237-1 [Araneus ventricosus]
MEMLLRSALLLRGNTRPYSASVTRDLVQRLRWPLLEHPLYRLALAPIDFQLFGQLKKHLRGLHFRTDAIKPSDVAPRS